MGVPDNQVCSIVANRFVMQIEKKPEIPRSLETHERFCNHFVCYHIVHP